MDLVKPIASFVDKEFLYCTLTCSKFSEEIKEYANGVNVLHLSPDRIAEYKILLPEQKIQYDFAEIVRPNYQLIDIMQGKNISLSQTRDLLLPKLISGQIDVSDLDIDIGADAA